MITTRELFLNHLAQTSPEPLLLEIVKAEGCELTDINGKKYVDFISGISVSNMGHRHPAVVEAITNQLQKYMHLMVYGEYIQSPQIELAQLLTTLLPASLNSCYFVNSGTEATEGAMKLAKRFTGRHKFLAFHNSYHGHTQGAMSLMDSPYFTENFKPLLPGISFIEFNNIDEINKIESSYAAIFIELVKAETGCTVADKTFINALVQKCKECGVLIILDEIQSGFARTGSMFAFEDYNFVPDILTLGKGMGGGMPIGAFISNKNLMATLSNHPVLGHITTFGGHPVNCAAAVANINVISQIVKEDDVIEKGELIRSILKHALIKKIHGKGLLLAVEFENEKINKQIIKNCIENGIITDWFLYAPHMMRIAPPLNCSKEIIEYTCHTIIKSCNQII